MEIQRENRRRRDRAESGQAIVLIALMMIALIGILGLTIDGGGLYFKHRDTQNAVDAAVLAALYTKCTTYPYRDNARVITDGQEAAASNGYSNSVNNVDVTINPDFLPPGRSAWPSGFVPYVQATIHASKPSYFIQLVYRDPLWVTSSAIGECDPSMTSVLPEGMAIISLRPTDCVGGSGGDNPSFRVTGGGGVYVHNAGIYVNSSDPNCALWITNNGMLDVDGICAVYGGIDGSPLCGSIEHPAEPLWSYSPLQDIAPPDQACNSGYAQTDPKDRTDAADGAADGIKTIGPGYYADITISNNDVVVLQPGLYCVGHLKTTGGELRGHGVVFYMPPAHDVWDVTAQTKVDLTGPRTNDCVTSSNELLNTCIWSDLLLWADATQEQYATPSMAQEVHINGAAGYNWSGTIYAPRSQCRIEGQGTGSAINSQVICWSVDLNGGSRLDISYDPPDFLRTAPRVTLNQ